jgi:FkbM family methyltransferase
MNILTRVLRKAHHNLTSLFDRPFSRTITVYDVGGTKLFSIYNYGEVCRARAHTFSTKEPETIEWIKSFPQGDVFLDVGANIGIYSLFAASRGIKTFCIEPDSQNFALLNMNISNNDLGNLVKAFPIALNDKPGFSELHLKKMEWGGALSSFSIHLDQFQRSFSPEYCQGCYGDTMDSFISKLCPTVAHIKINVDGNENLILMGGSSTLALPSLKSTLIELDETRTDYQSSIRMIESAGFRLNKKTHSSMFDNTEYASTSNHIFIRAK